MSEIRPVSVGSVWDTNKCGHIEVIEYHGCNDVLVKFLSTGHIRKSTTTNVRSGQVKDPYSRTVFGVGYLGEGDNKKVSDGRKTKAYSVWSNMLKRCYGGKNSDPNYSDCTVCDEWLSFQAFADWYSASIKDGMEGYELDKDLKIIGNRIYSPHTCSLVPSMVNTFVLDNKKSRNGTLIGVHYYKSRKKFTAQCANPIRPCEYHLGYFDSEIDAHLAWRKRKSELALELANIQHFKYVSDLLIKWKENLDSEIIHPYR